MRTALLLPLRFDAMALQGELEAAARRTWTPHFNVTFYAGDWSGLVLRGPTEAGSLYAGRAGGSDTFVDQEILNTCAYFRHVMASFQCPLKSVRLLRLTPGSVIREHSDPDLGYEEGEIRIHVPVRTNPGVEFFLAGERIWMDEGEAWYLDLSKPHRVQNLGDSDRVHLVLDCQLNDWLRAMLESADATQPPHVKVRSSADAFAAFQDLVLDEPGLHSHLLAFSDEQAFLANAVSAGVERGFQFTIEDVRSALMEARRSWMEKNIV
jgi:hypothetical protein